MLKESNSLSVSGSLHSAKKPSILFYQQKKNIYKHQEQGWTFHQSLLNSI